MFRVIDGLFEALVSPDTTTVSWRTFSFAGETDRKGALRIGYFFQGDFVFPAISKIINIDVSLFLLFKDVLQLAFCRIPIFSNSIVCQSRILDLKGAAKTHLRKKIKMTKFPAECILNNSMKFFKSGSGIHLDPPPNRWFRYTHNLNSKLKSHHFYFFDFSISLRLSPDRMSAFKTENTKIHNSCHSFFCAEVGLVKSSGIAE